MKVTSFLWPEISNFVFLDKKISSDNGGEMYLKSRFNLIVKFFELNKLPFNRQNFIQLIQHKKEQGCKNSYINNIIKVGKYIHEYLLLTYKYDSGLSDFTYFKRERPMFDVVTPQEIQSIAELNYPYIRLREEKNLLFKAIFYFLALTGCRIGELLNLKWNEVNEQFCIFRETKTDTERMVPITPFLWNLISRLPKTSSYVFSNYHGQMSKGGIDDDLHKRCELLGIKKRIWLHLFRHSFAVEMLRNNDVTLVAKILGHRDLASTLTYSHYLMDDLRAAIFTHPLLKGYETFEVISKRLKVYVLKTIDTRSFKLSIQEVSGNLSIQITSV